VKTQPQRKQKFNVKQQRIIFSCKQAFTDEEGLVAELGDEDDAEGGDEAVHEAAGSAEVDAHLLQPRVRRRLDDLVRALASILRNRFGRN
jgi:hypothetical protein